MVLDKTLESPLDCKEIQPVHPKDQSWIFIGRTDVEAETPMLWPPDGKSWLIRKDRDAGKDWRQEEKGTTEDEMFGWHHQFNGHEFEQAPGDGEGQGSLACCSPRSCKVLDTTEWLNNNNKREVDNWWKTLQPIVSGLNSISWAVIGYPMSGYILSRDGNEVVSCDLLI